MGKILLAIVVTTAVLMGAALFWDARVNMSQAGYEMTQKLKEKHLEIELQQLKNTQQRDTIEYRLTVARLEQDRDVVSAPSVRSARIIGLTALYLWPVWVLVAGLTLAALYAYRQSKAVEKEVQIAQNTLLIDQERAILKTLERSVPAIVKGALKVSALQPVPVQEVQAIDPAAPEALRAFSGNVHFSQARLDEDFDPGAVLMGRNIESGGLCQIPLEDLQSLCENGLQKQGKSVLLLALAHHALSRKYLLQEHIRLVLIDIHGGYPDSLLTRIEALLPNCRQLFDRVFAGEEEIDKGLTLYFDSLIQAGKAARNGIPQPLTLILFDEYTETVTALPSGREIEARVKRLFNYRKAGISLALVMFEAGKNAQSAKGLNVSKLAVSKALFHTAKDEGARFLTGGAEAATLDRGEYLLLLPGMAEPERIKAPLFAAMDFAPFAEFQVWNEDADSQGDTAGDTDRITPEAVKAYLEAQKELTQNGLAKEADLSKSDLSKWMNRRKLSQDKQETIVTALRKFLYPDSTRELIVLEDYRK